MMTLNELRKHKDLINSIDWTITPENAVDIPMGMGDASTGNNIISDKTESLYFVIVDGEAIPQATLIKRKMKEAVELAKIPVPRDLFLEACENRESKTGRKVHPLNDTLKQWIFTVLKDYPGMFQ